MEKIMDNVKLIWSKTNRFHRVITVFVIMELRLLPSGQLGFYCNDPALSHAYTGDTINWKLLMGVCLLLPLAVLLVVERKYYSDKDRSRRRALRWYREYFFGFLINLTTVQLLKLIVGSPRPHFFDTCKPKEATTCQGSDFVSSYTCTKAHWINQSDKSFPSGHTSLALHAGIFIAYYLYRRCPYESRTVRVAQSISVIAAVYCAASRMTDHRHHWWDVLAGVAIGAAGLIYTIHYLCKNFESSKAVTKEPKVEEIDKDQSNDPLVENEA